MEKEKQNGSCLWGHCQLVALCFQLDPNKWLIEPKYTLVCILNTPWSGLSWMIECIFNVVIHWCSVKDVILWHGITQWSISIAWHFNAYIWSGHWVRNEGVCWIHSSLNRMCKDKSCVSERFVSDWILLLSLTSLTCVVRFLSPVLLFSTSFICPCFSVHFSLAGAISCCDLYSSVVQCSTHSNSRQSRANTKRDGNAIRRLDRWPCREIATHCSSQKQPGEDSCAPKRDKRLLHSNFGP